MDSKSIANQILKAAGTNLQNYMPSTQERIILATEKAMGDYNTYLLETLADIREKSGVGHKPMLSELADAIAERMQKGL